MLHHQYCATATPCTDSQRIVLASKAALIEASSSVHFAINEDPLKLNQCISALEDTIKQALAAGVREQHVSVARMHLAVALDRHAAIAHDDHDALALNYHATIRRLVEASSNVLQTTTAIPELEFAIQRAIAIGVDAHKINIAQDFLDAASLKRERRDLAFQQLAETTAAAPPELEVAALQQAIDEAQAAGPDQDQVSLDPHILQQLITAASAELTRQKAHLQQQNETHEQRLAVEEAARRKAQAEYTLFERETNNGKRALWECRLSATEWIEYDESTRQSLEIAYQENSTQGNVLITRQLIAYEVRWPAWVQTRTDGKYTTQREIRRREVYTEAASKVLAAEQAKEAAEAEAQTVKQQAAAALQIAKRQASIAVGDDVKIWNELAVGLLTEAELQQFFDRRQDSQGVTGRLQIARGTALKVMNPDQLRAFRSAGCVSVRPNHMLGHGDSFLFHGCPQVIAPNIQSEGLRMKYAANGMLGIGLYGAPDPRKSSQYCEKQGVKNPNGNFMFICRFNLKVNTKHYKNKLFQEFCVYDDSQVVVLWMVKLE
jgi:hypothetical protein